MDVNAFLYWVAVAVTAGLVLGAVGLWGRWYWGLTRTFFKDRIAATFNNLITATMVSLFGGFGLFLLVATLSGHATWHW